MGTNLAIDQDGDSLRSDIRRAIGEDNPKLAELTTDVLYGDIWERPQLSKRDRSLLTVGALIATNHPSELRIHLTLARRNGLSEEALIEAITHLAFYSGWPNAMTAMRVATEAFAEQ